MPKDGIEYLATRKRRTMNRNSWLTQVVKPQLGTVQCAVEVGVWRGDYSVNIMQALQPNQFVGVDPYKLYPGMVSAPGPEYHTQQDLDQLAKRVQQRLQSQGGELHRVSSVESATQFEDLSVDFVYIDGDHTHEGVTADIQAWWPKVRQGGILSGDDYTSGTTGKGFAFGVISAVEQFATQHKLSVNVTSGTNPSWWVIKGESNET